jgi:hypothetical protein
MKRNEKEIRDLFIGYVIGIGAFLAMLGMILLS